MRLFNTLAVISLRVRQTEQSLLEEWAAPKKNQRPSSGETVSGRCCFILVLVPESKSDILETVRVAYAGYTVLAPSVGPGARVIVGEVFCKSNRRDRQWPPRNTILYLKHFKVLDPQQRGGGGGGAPLEAGIAREGEGVRLTAPGVAIMAVILPHCIWY